MAVLMLEVHAYSRDNHMRFAAVRCSMHKL